MNPITYSLFAYFLTAVISFLVIAIIVGINFLINRKDKQTTSQS